MTAGFREGDSARLRDLLVPPDLESFRHEGHDPNDRKLGGSVAADLSGLDGARFALLGCPQDEGVRRNRGRPGAAAGPREIRRRLYRLSAPASLAPGRMVDVGDVRIAATLEETHDRHREAVEILLRSGRSVIVLGGGNDISYPDVGALASVERDVIAFNVDSHFDVREAPRPHSGTPYRQLLEEGLLAPRNLYQLGHKPGANSPVYARYLEERDVPVYSFDELDREGVERVLDSILRSRSDASALFWGFDLDAVRSSDAPGVSAGYPLGFTAADICRVAARAGRDPRTRMIEISECNPERDIDGRTSKLAAMMIVSYLENLPPPD